MVPEPVEGLRYLQLTAYYLLLYFCVLLGNPADRAVREFYLKPAAVGRVLRNQIIDLPGTDFSGLGNTSACYRAEIENCGRSFEDCFLLDNNNGGLGARG